MPYLAMPETFVILVFIRLMFRAVRLPVLQRWICSLRGQPGVSNRLGLLPALQYHNP
jgi:hypothetical protein